MKYLRDLLRPESASFLTMDALRFFAACSVVVYHYHLGLEVEPFRVALAALFDRGFQFVDLFFVLSGFIIAAVYTGRITSGTDYRDFLVKRVARLWPLHMLLLTLYLALWGLSVLLGVELNTAAKYDASCIIPNVLMVHSFDLCGDFLTFNYVSWSISAEMAMYVAAPALLLVGSRWPMALFALSATVFVALCVLAFDPPWEKWTYDLGVVRALPAFPLGIFLFFIKGKLAVLPSPHWLMLAALGLFFALSVLAPGAPLFVSLLVMYLVAVFATAADARQDVPNWIRSSASLSPLTYGIYMWHPILFTVGVSFFVKRLLPASGIVADLLVVLIGISVAAVALMSLGWFERPARRWLTEILATRSPVPKQAPPAG